MRQLTLRIPDELAVALKRVAAERGESVNTAATRAITALVDPDAAGSEVERVRERLAAAGLLATRRPGPPVDANEARFQEARRSAGGGTLMSDLISEGRE